MKKAPIVVLLLCQRLAAQSHQLDFTMGYNYQNSDQGQDVRANLNGWFASLQFDLSDLLAINGEVDNYYGSIQEASAKQQNFVVGPQLTFGPEKAKLRPFAYVEAGDQRSSSSGSVDHSFDLQTGAGAQVKLTERLALQFVPAEYDLATPSSGATHSYTANVGVSWTLWRQVGVKR